MRVYIAPGAGLGDREISALKRLSPNSRMLILDELKHPDSHGTVKWILNHRDPEAALADAITENVHQASADAASGGLGGGLGKSFFKKLAKLHRKIFHSVVKVQKKIFKADPIHKAVFGGKKRRPGTPAPVAAAAAAAAAAPAPSGDPGPSAPPPVYTPPPTPDASQYTQATQGPVNYVQEQPPDAAPVPAPDAAPAPASAPTPAPDASSPYQTGTDETAGLPSASGYTLVVEGQTITNYPVPIGTLSSLVQSGTQPGDRFEIMADGVGTGLRVRTTTGFISIQESMRAQVMAMPHDQVLALLTQAASTVAATGTPTPDAVPSAPAAGGGGMLWLLGAGAAAALSMSGGKRR